MAETEDKNKIKITSLISDRDRKMNMPQSEIHLNASHIPTKDEIKKKALDDMLKRIKSRG